MLITTTCINYIYNKRFILLALCDVTIKTLHIISALRRHNKNYEFVWMCICVTKQHFEPPDDW